MTCFRPRLRPYEPFHVLRRPISTSGVSAAIAILVVPLTNSSPVVVPASSTLSRALQKGTGPRRILALGHLATVTGRSRHERDLSKRSCRKLPQQIGLSKITKVFATQFVTNAGRCVRERRASGSRQKYQHRRGSLGSGLAMLADERLLARNARRVRCNSTHCRFFIAPPVRYLVSGKLTNGSGCLFVCLSSDAFILAACARAASVTHATLTRNLIFPVYQLGTRLRKRRDNDPSYTRNRLRAPFSRASRGDKGDALCGERHDNSVSSFLSLSLH
ncbi:hypothetical protein EVAR_43813_1 [Eumeta japonica]|uniref:Uncharacterized protein n=1 Tax=Eumeta variegata TaxID=151549 RepID=A0A4C1WXG2_EUMVA|nr:hypothetical protein EVAR_43813_1 [Eumeta japonica]